jgi:hypothetical protein
MATGPYGVTRELEIAMSASTEWAREAACRGHDPTLWDVDHEKHKVRFRACAKCAKALRICRDCPVRDLCAAQAEGLADVATMRAGWVLVPEIEGGRGQVRPARPCPGCSLPVLRGPVARYCSTLCRRRAAGLDRPA